MRIKGALFVELFGVYRGLICSSTTLSRRLFARQILQKVLRLLKHSGHSHMNVYALLGKFFGFTKRIPKIYFQTRA